MGNEVKLADVLTLSEYKRLNAPEMYARVAEDMTFTTACTAINKNIKNTMRMLKSYEDDLVFLESIKTKLERYITKQPNNREV